MQVSCVRVNVNEHKHGCAIGWTMLRMWDDDVDGAVCELTRHLIHDDFHHLISVLTLHTREREREREEGGREAEGAKGEEEAVYVYLDATRQLLPFLREIIRHDVIKQPRQPLRSGLGSTLLGRAHAHILTYIHSHIYTQIHSHTHEHL